jgi:hypothetical protein
MAQPTNTFSSYDAAGIREDLSDIIDRTEREEVPFYSTIGRSKATQRIHEWQTQALASAVDTNAVLEGDEATMDAATPTVRVNNRTQIADKTATVSGSVETFDKAGRASEMDYQVILKGLELKRDMEKQMLSNKPSVAGTDTLPSQSAGFSAWLTSNVSKATDGTNGGFGSSAAGLVAARVDGTLRQFQESHINDVMELAFDNGARPTVMMLPAALKTRFSAFAGIADLRREVGDKQATIVGGADAYISNFGKLTVVPQTFMRSRDCIIYDPKKVKLAVARPMKSWELAKTGDTEKRQILTEYTLEVNNEKAHCLVTDVQKNT